jgi:general secretion pathway protein M
VPRPRAEQKDRLYALGLLVLVVALAYGVGLHWWWSAPMIAMEDRIEELRQQELQARMELRQKPVIEKRLVEVRRLEAANPGFLPEASAELAQAGLTQRIESQIAAVSPDHGACTIVQRTPTPWAGAAETYQRVVVQVRLLCGMNELSALLHAFESGRPQLFIGNLNIISQHNFNQENGTIDSSAPLNISFDLYGYLRTGAARAR